MPSTQALQIEKKLAIAHAVLWEAAQIAETMRDQGLADDLHSLRGEVGTLNIALTQSTRKPPRLAV